MKTKIRVIDYGVGNLHSVLRACSLFSPDVRLASSSSEIAEASHLILPGVGAFGTAVDQIQQREIKPALMEAAFLGKYMLGLCVGMQIMADSGYENGKHEGLGLIPGEVSHLLPDQQKSFSRVPNMGWRRVIADKQSVRENIKTLELPLTEYYFAHSFEFIAEDKLDVTGYITFDERPVVAAVQRDNVFGVQFHPEKSGPEGLQFLERFINL